MKVGSKGYYGLLALADLAQNSKGRQLAQVKEIARRQRIPEEYLGQIMVLLKRANLVHGARGPGGGYRLARAAEATSIAEIVHAVDEPLRATRCGAGKGCMVKGERCLTHDLWEDLGDRIEDYLASVSLADVVSGRLRERAAA